MKLYGVSLMRNEVDVLETWARYHVQLLDRLIIMDHLSVDGTRDLAMELENEGLPIEVLTTDEPAYEQSERVTSLGHRAVEHGADWVFPLDADEFLDTGGPPVVEGLLAAEPGRPVSIPWRTYVPTRSDPQDEANVLLRMTWRLEEELRPYYKIAIPRPVMKRSSAVVAMGSHDVLDSGEVVKAQSCHPSWRIAHFPVRSAEQLARKVFVGWTSLLANPGRAPRSAYQWKEWFDILVDTDLSALDPTELALAYLTAREGVDSSVRLVKDPLPDEVRRVETQARRGLGTSPVKALASAAELLASELGRMRRMFPDFLELRPRVQSEED